MSPATGATGRRENSNGLSLRAETHRKLIHAATSLIPVIIWFAPRSTSLLLLGFGVAAALAIELARVRSRWLRLHFLVYTRRLLRRHERRRLAGATYMAIGYFLALLLYPLPIAVTAMLYNSLGDASAALVGRRWGRHRLGSGKSWEGAAAGFLVNLSVGLIVPGVGLLPASIGAAVAALLELAPLPLDDNLRVTLGGGAALWLSVILVG